MTRHMGLTKNTPRLLRMVNKRPHASDDDHVEQQLPVERRPQRNVAEKTRSLPTTPARGGSSQFRTIVIWEDDADVNAEPKSDDSTELPSCQYLTDKTSGFRQTISSCFENLDQENRSTSKLPEAARSSQDRKRSSTVQGSTSDENVESKRRKIASPLINIHVQRNKQSALYGNGAKRKQRIQEVDREKKRKRQIQEARHIDAWKNQAKSTGFKKLDDINLGKELSPSSSFVISGAVADCEGFDDSSDALSDLEHTSAVEEGQRYLPLPKAYVPTKECQFCHEEVETLLHEDFMDRYNHGRELNYKWERRFCSFHRKHKAERQWEERGYPKIDWSSLEKRMQEHDTLLRKVLNGSRQSYYRDKAAGQLKRGRNKLENMITDDSVKPGASVGYYGPRGQQAMMEHIMTSLGDDIRVRAAKDKLVLSAGASGGVAGFVQNVLVPHLAELLIKEDGRLTVDWVAEVRETIAESGELGEIMHPELEDDIRHVDSDDEV